jgi:hypothetical protein
MRKLALILLIVFVVACDKEDDPDKNTSINGYWTVKTPDDQTTVTFRVSQDADNIHIIDRVSVVHNGTEYNTKPIDADIIVLSPTEIESITFVNNSFQIPFFVIRFMNISVSSDFIRMDIDNSSFNVDADLSSLIQVVSGEW